VAFGLSPDRGRPLLSLSTLIAAEQGYVFAQFNLGNIYSHGQGVPENIEEFNLDERQRISEEGGYYPRPND
jgi:hypothetical protein